MFKHLFNTYETVTPPPNVNILLPSSNDFIIDPLKLDLFKDNQISNPFITDDQIKDPFIDDNSQFDDQLINNIINTGRSFIGNKEFNDSEFIQHIYKQNGINIPKDVSKAGKEIQLTNAKPGDIICFKNNTVLMVSRIDPLNNLIYVIEDKKHGIVEEPLTKKSSDITSVRRIINPSDPFLTDLDIKSPTSSNGKFNTKKDFITALNQGFQKVLIDKGLDPNYSYVLTAQAALESGWGKHLAGNFNYGGIKISGKDAKIHPEKVSRVLTTDYIPGKGYLKRYQNFRKFSSVEDYCNYKVNLLSNQRYNAFNTISSNNPYNFILHILTKGYGSDYGGPKSRKYASSVVNNINIILDNL